MSAAPDLPGDLLSFGREDLTAAEALDRAERGQMLLWDFTRSRQ
jgi:hypothetical protein